MSTGFRKSLLGYNQDDVINYVRKMHAGFEKKENDFKAHISDLESKINALSHEQEKLQIEKAELNSKLEEYNARAAETERLTENIGKLYLVAQSNAKTVMENAEESSKLAADQIERNVSAIEETHSALNELRLSITATAESFNKELDGLMQSLEETKCKITADYQVSANAGEEFSQLLKAISK